MLLTQRLWAPEGSSSSITSNKASSANPTWSRRDVSVTIFEKQSGPHSLMCPGFSSLWGLIIFKPFLRLGILFPILMKPYTSFKTQLQGTSLCNGPLLSSVNDHVLLSLNSLLSTPFSVDATLILIPSNSRWGSSFQSDLPLLPSCLATRDQ